jgi:CHAP domain
MGFKGTALAICVLFGTGGLNSSAEAATPDRNHHPNAGAGHASTARHTIRHGRSHIHFAVISGAWAATSRGGRHAALPAGYINISCVPYAREVTGMQISGNGWQWWGNAAGSYARGHRPEPGAVLAFRSTGNMRYGHVAVVSKVLGPRHLLINHANWAGPGIRRGSVMEGVHVIDVSEMNDWTEVRVQIGWDGDSFGRSYPTFGFIYNRPDNLRWAQNEPTQVRYDEVAEAPESASAPRADHRGSRR